MSKSELCRSALFAALLTSCLSIPVAHAEPGERGSGRRGPPPEALEACVGKAEGDVCTFTGRRGDANGTCFVPPRDGEALACKPENHRPDEHRGEPAEEG